MVNRSKDEECYTLCLQDRLLKSTKKVLVGEHVFGGSLICPAMSLHPSVTLLTLVAVGEEQICCRTPYSSSPPYTVLQSHSSWQWLVIVSLFQSFDPHYNSVHAAGILD